MSRSKLEDSEDEDMEQLQYKIILLGDGSVGKTLYLTSGYSIQK